MKRNRLVILGNVSGLLAVCAFVAVSAFLVLPTTADAKDLASVRGGCDGCSTVIGDGNCVKAAGATGTCTGAKQKCNEEGGSKTCDPDPQCRFGACVNHTGERCTIVIP